MTMPEASALPPGVNTASVALGKAIAALVIDGGSPEAHRVMAMALTAYEHAIVDAHPVVCLARAYREAFDHHLAMPSVATRFARNAAQEALLRAARGDQ